MVRTSTTASVTAAIWKLGAGMAVFFLPFQPAFAVSLEAHVEHTERLPAVEAAVRPGAVFDLNAVSEPSDNLWVRIPTWLAGTWQVSTETRVYQEDCRTGETSDEHKDFAAKTRFVYGQQKDRLGDIWHYLGTPYSSSTDFPSFTEYHQVASKECTETGVTEIAIKTKATVVRVSKASGKVSKTFQQESITDYSQSSADELRLEASTKVFDSAGNPTAIVKNEAIVTRAEPFVPIDHEGDKDYRELFKQYLASHGRSYLFPE